MAPESAGITVELSISPDDLREVVEIEEKCWPLSEFDPSRPPCIWQADRLKFEVRQEIGALYIARYQGKSAAGKGTIVGHMTAYSCRWAGADAVSGILKAKDINWDGIVSEYGFPRDFCSATLNGLIKNGDESAYLPESEVMHLISMNVPPEFREGIFQKGEVIGALTNGLLQSAKNAGTKYVVGITTLPDYHRFEKMEPDEYVGKKQDGRFLDPNIRRYKRTGAEIVCAAPDYMPGDLKSRGHGAMVVYALR